MNDGESSGISDVELLAIWRQLSDGVGEPGSRAARLREEFPAGRVRLSLDEEGRPLFLIPVLGGVKPDWFWRGRRVEARREEKVVDGRPLRCLTVTCLDDSYRDLFAEFGVELLRHLRRGRPAVDAFLEALRRFRRLAEPPGQSRWDRERTAGLLAELLVLDRLRRLGLRDPAVWRGPLREPKDFDLGEVLVECKAGVGEAGQRIVVHGLQQLSVPEEKQVLLMHGVFEEGGEESLSVGDLARQLLDEFSGSGVLAGRLREAGLDPDVVPDGPWNRHRFDLIGMTWYEVRQEFPRLAPELLYDPGLGQRIDAVTYVLELPRIDGFLIEPVEAAEILGRSIGRVPRGEGD